MVMTRGAAGQAAQDQSPLMNIQGFALVDQSPGRYVYVHDKVDTMNVSVLPFPPGTMLGKGDDTAAYVFADVDQFRKDFYGHVYAAAAAGVDQATAPHTDPIRVQGKALRGDYTVIPYRLERVAGPREMYYAVYALPGGLVRVRSDYPEYRRSMARLINFSHGFLDALLRAASDQAGAGQ
jgi:hypothetical protein